MTSNIESDEQLPQTIDSTINEDTTPDQTENDTKLVEKSDDESDSHGNINKIAKNLMKSVTDPDPQKNLLKLAITLAELQEQNRLSQAKMNESEKRSAVFIRERDHALVENGKISTAKVKLENLCRELHQHNQQIRDGNVLRQQDDETKRRELATKFQATIDEITSKLTDYSEKSTLLRDQNVQLSEELGSIVKKYEIREQEIEAAVKKKELELRLTETSLEQSYSLINERTELIKQERQLTEAERLVLYQKCEELVSSEFSLRAQVTVYAERYQEFQNIIQQSGQMVTSCHTQIEAMGKRIKKLEEERDDFRDRWKTTEQNQRKSNEDMKLMEKEKRQLDIKLDKLDRLCRTLQQERADLKTRIKNLTNNLSITPIENVSSTSEVNKSITSNVSTSSKTTTNGHDLSENDVDQSTNLYDSELGRIAKTVD